MLILTTHYASAKKMSSGFGGSVVLTQDSVGVRVQLNSLQQALFEHHITLPFI